MKSLSPISKAFIVLVVTSGLGVMIATLVRTRPVKLSEFLTLLVISVVASRLRLKLPGLTGMMSVNLPFILVAVAEMSTAEAMVVGCISTVVQSLPRTGRKFNWVHALFNFSNMVLAVAATRLLYNSVALGSVIKSHPLLLAIAAVGYFAVNSMPVAIIISLTENKNPVRAWIAMFQLSYPYYLVSAGMAGVVVAVSAQVGWQVPVGLLPLMLGVFYSYRRYFAVAQSQAELKRAPQSATVAQAAS